MEGKAAPPSRGWYHLSRCWEYVTDIRALWPPCSGRNGRKQSVISYLFKGLGNILEDRVERTSRVPGRSECSTAIPPKWNIPFWRGGGVWFISLMKLMQLRLWKLTDSESSFSYKIHEVPFQDDTNRKKVLVKTLVKPLSDRAGNYRSCPFWGELFGDAGTLCLRVRPYSSCY